MTFKKLVLMALACVMVLALGVSAITLDMAETAEDAIVEEAVLAEESTNVAKVGDTEYATIDEAIDAWTNGRTLTLLSDVTLTDVFTFKSTESRTLDLGTYTMTAASGKHAIEIICNGQGTATYGLTIKADATNPGGITASGKSCIYYRKSGTTKDRVIIRIDGGVFNGSYAVNVYSSNRGTNCPQVSINGGVFNGNVNVGHGKLIVSGGIFNGWINCTGDSTAYRQFSGGTFKSWQFMTADAANKFWVGTSQANYNVGVYVDDEGYLVVGGPVITEAGNQFEASTTYSSWSSYLKYSSAAANGLYYTSVDKAMSDIGRKGSINLYCSYSNDIKTSGSFTMDMSDSRADYTGNVTLGGASHEFTVIFDSENPYEGTVTPTAGYALNVTETKGVIVTRIYSNVSPEAKIGDALYASIEEALAKVENDETVILLADAEIDNTICFNKEITFTLDGNGKKITPSENFTATDSVITLGSSTFDISATETRNYTVKNIIFDGWTTDHIIRTQGVTANIEGCTFSNNTQSRAYLALVSFTNSKPSLKDCLFDNNDCLKCVDLGSWGVNENIVVDNCTFTNNTCSVTSVVYLHNGSENGTFTNCEFVGNTVNANGNGAVLYLAFNENVVVKNNLFKDNHVNGTTKRTAGAIQVGALNDISENVFVNNTASINGSDPALRQVVEAGYYHAGNLSSNYWSNGDTPVWGSDIVVEYSNYTPVVDDYYADYTLDANGNVVPAPLKYIVKDIVLDFVDVTATDAESEKLYNINLVASGKVINRLNSVDLTFVLTQHTGENEFEIIASNDEVVINPVNNSTVRYEFHYDGKTDVDTDTAETITIGQVKFTGYGKFSFAVDASKDTNAAHATKNEDNIVDTFVPGGNTELEYGNFDISDNDITEIDIAVPTRDLEIIVDFPNAVAKQVVVYQNMTVTVSGGDLAGDIVINLGNEDVEKVITTEFEKKDAKFTVDVTADNKYTVNVIDVLTVNTTYNVTVEGAGYRTARYAVTMTEDKELNFWNNVKDNEAVVEVKKDSSKVTKNFLAGDIVGDNNINIYDLSAVVSYFATETNVEAASDYAKYDLNRDGVIDSKDVAYVLVSWGE